MKGLNGFGRFGCSLNAAWGGESSAPAAPSSAAAVEVYLYEYYRFNPKTLIFLSGGIKVGRELSLNDPGDETIFEKEDYIAEFYGIAFSNRF